MPATTPGIALPYPVGTDPVQQGDDAIKALAERIEARMGWGCLAQNKRVDVAGPFTVATAYCQLTNITLRSGRRYRIDAFTIARNTGTTGLCTFHIRRNAVVVGGSIRTMAGGTFDQVYLTAFVDGDGLAAGVDQYIGPQAPCTVILENGGNTPAHLVVTDIGPTVVTGLLDGDQLEPEGDPE